MPFETPITVREAVERIRRREYVLPAIQREFVWQPDKIIGLFDSLLREFPIGSLLFWRVDPEHRSDFQFYHFLQDYHERDLRHNPRADLSGEGSVIATLDGQQRLTSLYIGLKGTYAEKRPYARKNRDDAYEKRRLYLNLARAATGDELLYDLRFRADNADFTRDDAGAWIRVGKALDFTTLGDVINFLRRHDLLADEFPQQALTALYQAVNERHVLASYVETSQSLDKVLTIFIRVNSAGTELSYSDLILSIATAKWDELDAREEIHRLTDDVNRIGMGFSFSKDFALKASLMLGEYETRFAAENFRAGNMRRIEQMWPDIATSIRITVRLLASLGYSGDTLPSLNVVIPIVYYVYRAGMPAGLPEAAAFQEDRERIRYWLAIALLKRTFTGQADSVLRLVREVIRVDHEHGFPAESIVKALRTAPRTMTFGDDDVEAVLDGKYSNSYTFATLALLYPNLDFRNAFHIDHVHPRSHFTKAQLRRRDVGDAAVIADYMDRADLIANLQLLRGTQNLEKSSRPFKEWLEAAFPDPARRAAFRAEHYIPDDVEPDFRDFLTFYERRRDLMRAGLRSAVGLPAMTTTPEEGATAAVGMDGGQVGAAP